MENRICPTCKTENEPEYTYCKNCGTPLSAPESIVPPVCEHHESGEFIDGNPIDKVYTFVGKNADKIVPKFIKINASGSKIQWCWPPFIWGFFLGPIGVAIWFLYRKMYKPACIFGAIAVAISYISAAANYFFNLTGATADSLDKYFNSFLSGKPFDYEGFFAALSNRDMLISSILSTTQNAINLACALIAGLFGIYIYKKFTAKKIHSYKPISADPNYSKIGLSVTGGTSVGTAVLGSIIISVIANVPSFILSIMKFMEVIYRL